MKGNCSSIRIFSVAFASFLALSSWAQMRSLDDAQQLADSFWPMRRGGENPEQKIVYTETDSATQHPYFYIFTRGNDEGFIIISADERSKKILGYSDTGRFDVNNVPSEMRAWLRVYQKELKDLALTPDSLLQMDLAQMVFSKGRNASAFAPSVSPLLGDINYSQSYPYNAYCPQYYGQTSVTGWVATAAVQIMRYWQYPQPPTGKSHSYQLYDQYFGTTYDTSYDWDNMLLNYELQASNELQQLAVARLMVDAGIACDMVYSPSESSAYTAKMAMGMMEYFNYDDAMASYQRADFTQPDFVYYLKRELNAGRPVLFSGAGSGGGHCFVCDGYDANDLFHINWGWNGMSNDYFEITNLNPAALGIGGGSGGYNDDVMFIGGIQPPRNDTQPVYTLSFQQMSAPLNFYCGQRIVIQLSGLSNSSLQAFDGLVAIGLFANGELTYLLGSESVSLQSGYHYENLDVYGEFPVDLPDGSYQLVMVFKSNDDTQWHACLNNNCNCIDMVLSQQAVSGSFNYTTHYPAFPVTADDAPAIQSVPAQPANDYLDVDVMPGEDGGVLW